MSTRIAPSLCLATLFSALLVSAAKTAELDQEALSGAKAPQGAIWLDSLDVSKIEQGWGQPHAGGSVEGHALRIHGQRFEHGVGTHAVSEVHIDLHGAAEQFVSFVGVDDETGNKGSVTFEVWVDGKNVAQSGAMRGGDTPKRLEANLHGAKRLTLVVGDADDGVDFDHADWAGAVLVLAEGASQKPQTTAVPEVPAVVPDIVREDSPKPAIHGARVVGSTPGRPFLFLIPATGEKPLHYAAAHLPAGLSLDADTGVITGSLAQPGKTIVQIEVSNARGSDKRELTIVGGLHKLALTPPMGWNSWNCWASAVSDAKVRAAADAMAASGLAAHGFQFVNIDDCWEGGRDAKGEIKTNNKFPDMKDLADYVHSKGLKLGIYSSPGPKTCAGLRSQLQA